MLLDALHVVLANDGSGPGRTAGPDLVKSEIRAGFCDPAGETLEMHDRRN